MATHDRYFVRMLGRYELRELLGQGTTARVYAAIDREDGAADVVVKILSPKLLATPEQRAAFLAEGDVEKRVAHPGVGRVRRLDEAAGIPFVACERLAGRTLAEELAQAGGRLPYERAQAIARQAAEAIAAAHTAGVIHGDLRPSN